MMNPARHRFRVFGLVLGAAVAMGLSWHAPLHAQEDSELACTIDAQIIALVVSESNGKARASLRAKVLASSSSPLSGDLGFACDPPGTEREMTIVNGDSAMRDRLKSGDRVRLEQRRVLSVRPPKVVWRYAGMASGASSPSKSHTLKDLDRATLLAVARFDHGAKAIVSDASGSTIQLRVGDTINTTWRVVDIDADRITLVRSNPAGVVARLTLLIATPQ